MVMLMYPVHQTMLKSFCQESCSVMMDHDVDVDWMIPVRQVLNSEARRT